MPVDSPIHSQASIRRNLDTIRELCCSADVTIPKDANEVFSLTLQNVDAIPEQDSTVTAKYIAPESVYVGKETAATSLGGWTLDRIYRVRKREKSGATVELFNTDHAAVHDQVSG